MDFRRALAILEKRRWILVISVLVTTALVYGVTRLMPSRWMAAVRLITPTGLADPLRKISDAGEPDGAVAARIYSVLARGKDVMEASAKVASVSDPLPKIAESIEFEGSGSHMFELRYYDSDPARASAMANALATNLIEQNRKHNSAEAQRAVDLLGEQLGRTDQELQTLQGKYDQYCIENQIIPGDFISQVKGIAKEIEVAETSKAEANARIAGNRARIDALRGTSPTPPVEEAPPAPTEKESRLTRQIDDLDAEIRQMRRKYKDTYPELKARLDERKPLEMEMVAERARRERVHVAETVHVNPSKPVLDQIAADQALIQSEEMTIAARRIELDHVKRVNSKLGNLPSLIAEKSENRSGIVARLNTAKAALDVAERQNPISVLANSSETNPPVNTTEGRALKFVGLAGLCVLIASAGLAIALESADRRLKTIQEADELLPARVVAAIPQAREETPGLEWARVAEKRPLSPQSEAYRFLAQHVLAPSNRRYRSLMALSAKSGQGSTRTMSNLAITLAQAGQRVILVDANLRNPMLHRVFDLCNDVGLTDLLNNPDPSEIEKALQSTPVRNLRVLTSGCPVTNPWELFSSHRLEEFSGALKSMADYVLFDTPSALAYTDTLSLASIVDAALLCVRAVEPLTGAEHRLGEMFVLSDVQIMGSVLMDAPPGLIGSCERELRDMPPPPAAMMPALEAGEVGDLNPSPSVSTAVKMHDAAAFESAETVPALNASLGAEPITAVTPHKMEKAPTSNGSLWAEPAVVAAPDIAVNALHVFASRVADPAITSAPNTSETVPAVYDSPSAEPVPSADAANTSEDEQMDPAFEVTETRLTAPPPGRQRAVEDADLLFETRDLARQQSPDIELSTVQSAKVGTDTGWTQSEPIREEIVMTSANDTPPGGFPKSIHGYNVGAVDDYVRKINSRLESLLSQVQSESVRADQSKRLLEQMTSELETMRRRASDAEKREIAALEGQKRSEEESARLVQDLKEAREKVRGALDGALTDARLEHDALIMEERKEAESMVAEARRSAAAQVADANRMLESLQSQAAAMSAELQALRGLTGDNGVGYAEMVQSAEEQRQRLHADIEAERSYARTQIDQVVDEARRNAEEAGSRVAAVYREHEEHVRALGAECEALVHRIKDAIEMSLAQLPTLSVRQAALGTTGVGARLHSETVRRNDEPDKERVRDTREWRTGDWRNAS